jgi:ribosomal protein RSM22 (predicted rRNA methylase)
VLAARAAVLEHGGRTVAPCAHDLACPLPADDWCHFAARLPRSRLHRRAKGADLGWEDEKLSYAVLSREPVERPAARIIRPPQPRSGHVRLVTSDADGVVRERTVSRRQGDAYRAARKAAWGDAIER